MKIANIDLENLFGKISSIDINSVIANTKNIKSSDLKLFFKKYSQEYINTEFLLFSKYSPFIAIVLYLSFLLPLSYFAYGSLIEKQKTNSQYRSERDQIDDLNKI